MNTLVILQNLTQKLDSNFIFKEPTVQRDARGANGVLKMAHAIVRSRGVLLHTAVPDGGWSWASRRRIAIPSKALTIAKARSPNRLRRKWVFILYGARQRVVQTLLLFSRFLDTTGSHLPG